MQWIYNEVKLIHPGCVIQFTVHISTKFVRKIYKFRSITHDSNIYTTTIKQNKMNVRRDKPLKTIFLLKNMKKRSHSFLVCYWVPCRIKAF